MNKSDLIDTMGRLSPNIPINKINHIVNEIISVMNKNLAKNERIEIRGFGSFINRHRVQREARNPKIGTKIVVGEKYIPQFKAGEILRKRVNKHAL